MTMIEEVILVDENDNQIGLKEKMAAHRSGDRHRCFSIVLFNSKGEMLIQKRALSKYHSPGLWTNACCSHQRNGEPTLDAANRRLMEEMGMKCNLKEEFVFTYKARLDKGMTEHEVDHVLIGTTDIFPQPNPEEVSDYKYIHPNALIEDMKQNPSLYTVWIKIIIEELRKRSLI